MNQTINYQLINPSGNITAIVSGKYTQNQKQIINRAIFLDNKKIEQIGYIYTSNSNNYFEMMGNEFSANGSRAAGFCFLKGKSGQITFLSSGNTKPVIVTINKKQAILFINSKIFPKFNEIETNIIKTKLFKTTFYLINSPPQNNIIKSIINKNIENAVGIIFYQNNNITPYFYVKSVNKIVLENSCGSGSIALAFLLNINNIIQPSGDTLLINKNPLSISGEISYLGSYNVKINL